MASVTLYSVFYLFVIFSCFAVGYISFVNRSKVRYSIYLSILSALGGTWTFFLLLEIITNDPSLSITIRKLYHIPLSGIAVAWVFFALSYRDILQDISISKKRLALLLSLEPLIMLIIVFTNELHWYFWSDYVITNTMGGIDFQRGILKNVHTIYIQIISFYGTYHILRRSQMEYHRRYKTRSVLVAVAVFLPIIGGIYQIIQEPVINVPALSLAFSNLIFLHIMLNYDLVKISPVTRKKIIEEVDTGILTIDDEGMIIDVNKKGSELIGYDEPRNLIGKNIKDSVSDTAKNWWNLLKQGEFEDDYIEINSENENRYIKPRVTRSNNNYIILLEDLTKEIRQKQKLEKQKERLDDFAGVVSHDLRNPLNIAKGHAKIIEETENPEHADTVVEALERMDVLIEDVLSLARGSQDIENMEECEIETVVKEARNHVELNSTSLDIESSCTLEADRGCLLSLFENILRNAEEHTPEGTYVHVGCTESGFYVEDTGPGFPEELENDEIFEKGKTTNESGTGFGLAIVKEMAESHGWEVSARDGDKYGGARFEFTNVSKV